MERHGECSRVAVDWEGFARAEALLRGGAVGDAATALRRVGGLDQILARETRGGRRIAGPDFLVIGPARAGTTWLKQALKAHPDVFLPRGEPHYFSRSLDKAPSAYVAELADLPAEGSTTPVVGEKSPGYLAMPDDRIALCASLFPRLRLVCHVREPVARAWSMIRLLTPKADQAKTPVIRASRLARELNRTVQAGFYRAHLERWAAHFPPEQFLLLDFGRIEREPEAAFHDVLRHIGAPLCALPAQARTPPPAPPPVPEMVRRILDEAYGDEPWDLDTLRRSLDLAHRATAVGPAAPARSTDAIVARSTMAAWRLALHFLPDRPQVHDRLARLSTADGDMAAATRHIEALAGLEPNQIGHWQRLAKTLQGLGDLPRAAEAWTRVLELAPNDLMTRERLARIYAAQGAHERSAEQFSTLAEAAPDDPQAWRRLASCLRLTGDAAGELAAVTRALLIDASQPKLQARAEELRRQLARGADDGQGLPRRRGLRASLSKFLG